MSHPLEPFLPEITSSETVCEVKGRKIQVDQLKLPSGEEYEYVTFVSNDLAVMVLAQTESGKFVVNEEYRHPVGEILYSLPGGCVDGGELPKHAAKRELYEETGYSASEFIYLGQVHPMPGNNGQKTYYYLAKDAQKTKDPSPELCEIIETKEQTLDEIKDRLLKSKNIDGHFTSALCFKMLRGL
ncbi:MAG: hypothetical protein S4CHLAM6_07770 [Chlamydiae bacterium]|nr:hypothetical protein [Chlamydiota bacterium]